MTIRHPYFSKFETPTKSQDYQLDLNTDLISKDSTVFGRTAGPNPTLPILKNPDYILDLNPLILSKDALIVGKQYTTNPTIAILRGPQDWQDEFFLGLKGKDVVPGKVYTINPTLPPNRHTDWQFDLNPVLISQDTYVFGRVAGPNPLIPTPGQGFTLSYNLPLNTVQINPRASQTTVNPLLPTINPSWVSFLNPPGFPLVSQRTEVPYGPPPNPFWTQYLTPLYNFPAVGQLTALPPKGIEPKVADYILDLNFLLIGQDVLPKNQYSWPVPTSAIPGQSFVQSYNNPLNFVSGPVPFNQYNWPNPIRLVVGNQDYQTFDVNAPAPPPPPPQAAIGGRDPRGYEEPTYWRFREALDSLYRHMDAVNLGRKGGIISGQSRRGR